MYDVRMYNMMYEAALRAQIISLKARYDWCKERAEMRMEASATAAQINALQVELSKINN